jgi:ABC-type multidrug transport system ATPase subunit
MEDDMELRIERLSKTYPNGLRALREVDLAIGNGMFGLLGPNGAGKTTLMRIIATLQAPDAGRVTLDGLDVLRRQPDVRKSLGYLPQDFGVHPEVTAERMLDHIAVLKGLSDGRARRREVRDLLRLTNLEGVRRRRLGGFSGGMKQRFGIAQALLGSPRLLIVDEPTAGLDPEERIRFHNILSETSVDRVVILSTHIVDDVRQLCDRMAVLHEGRILQAGSTEEAVRRLAGKIWRRVIRKEEAADFDDRYNVLVSRMFAGNLEVDVLSDRKPEGFGPAEADLEHVYFASVKGAAASAPAA